MQAVRNPRRGEIGSLMTTGEGLLVYKSVAQDAPLRVDLLRKLSQTLPRTNQALFSLTNTGRQRIERCCRFPEDMFGCAELTYRGPFSIHQGRVCVRPSSPALGSEQACKEA